MNITKYFLFNQTRYSKGLHAASKKTATVFCTYHTITLFRAMLINYKRNKPHKYFYITNTTRKRISNIPTKDIKVEKLISLKNRSGETGVIHFNDKLHFAYSITKSGVCIFTCSITGKIIEYNNDLFHYGNIMDGFIYIDFYSDTLEYWINNPLDILQQKESLLKHDTFSLKRLKKCINNGEFVDKYYKPLDDDYRKRFSNTKLCLQAFMFVFFAKIIDTKRLNIEDQSIKLSERMRGKKATIEVIQVDTLWDENMSVINPFGVQGHFRNQPFGIERKDRKLIYIDSFMKTGYNRSATKTRMSI